jgi:AcrR family transcriptional regulator
VEVTGPAQLAIAGAMPELTKTGRETARFREKRARILDAATVLINERGVKGMTFVDVARVMDLNTTSVTYYYKRKELLAAAVFDRSIARMGEIVGLAGRASTPRERVRDYITLTLDLHAAVRREETAPPAILSDMRTLEGDDRDRLRARYVQVFRALRDFFGTPQTAAEKALDTARAHVLIETMFWLPAWLDGYSLPDLPRVGDRMFDLFDRGLAAEGCTWPGGSEIASAQVEMDKAYDFVRAATVLVNRLGYRGASVERIAAELNVTKGSFYHHLDAKDDLVLECFDRSYTRVSSVQRRALAMEGSYWERLAAAMAALLRIQFFDSYPLLRITALSALPAELRDGVISRSDRMARRFAGMMIDGITEGSIRAVDPVIASQMLMAMLNAAYDLRRWTDGKREEDAIAAYASTVTHGLFFNLD